MKLNDVKGGIRVKIIKLGDAKSMTIEQQYLDARKVGITGIVKGWVPGLGGDVWWVEHENGIIGAYCFNEFELA